MKRLWTFIDKDGNYVIEAMGFLWHGKFRGKTKEEAEQKLQTFLKERDR